MPENPDCAESNHKEAKIRPEEWPFAASEQPSHHIREPGAEEQADEDRGRAAMRDGDKPEKPPAKLVAEIKGQGEVNES
jgi:hypothetical protein